MNRLEDDVVIITGAGQGVGREMARLFAAEGARLVLAGRRREPLEETASLIDGESLVAPTDITIEHDVEEMVARTVARFGRVDVLINNAAQPGADRYIWEQTLENWNQTVAVDVTGAMLCIREVTKQSMLERRSGTIVSFSSGAGWRGMPRKSHYSTAKAALFTLTKVAAQELGPYGIRVNCIVPGGIETDLYVDWVRRIAAEEGRDYDEKAAELASGTALGRVTTPIEQARVALFLASDESSAITGQSIAVDAGSHMGA